MHPILQLSNIYKSYGGIQPLQGCSIDIYERDIVLISGENGAGKTTLFNTITGLESIDQGQIIWREKQISNLNPISIAKSGLVRLYQNPRVFKNMTVIDNLICAAPEPRVVKVWNQIFRYKALKSQSESARQKASELLIQFNLKEWADKSVGALSYGQQKLVSFCMLVMNNAQLILLDEPFAGLNPSMIAKFKEMIQEMNRSGMTFIIIEHNTAATLPICNRHITLSHGKATEQI